MLEAIASHIEITPGICGGKPRIAGHRITVADIAVWHEKIGLTADEIADQYDLSLADIYAALAYYHDHRGTIDAGLRAERKLIARLRKARPSLLLRKLQATSRG